MPSRSITMKVVGIAISVLLAQTVGLPDMAYADWKSRDLPGLHSDEEILTVAAGAALLVGGIYAYRKLVKQQPPRRSLHGLSLGLPVHDDGVLDCRAEQPNCRLRQLAPTGMQVGWDSRRNGVTAGLRWSF